MGLKSLHARPWTGATVCERLRALGLPHRTRPRCRAPASGAPDSSSGSP
jgi:hypothetical protein